MDVHRGPREPTWLPKDTARESARSNEFLIDPQLRVLIGKDPTIRNATVNNGGASHDFPSLHTRILSSSSSLPPHISLPPPSPARPSSSLLTYLISEARFPFYFYKATMAERYIPEHRRTQFKARNQFRPDELRRRREEQQVEIRKQKREENLAKRRGIQTRDGGIGVGGGMAAATESDDEASAIESEVGLAFYFSFVLRISWGPWRR